MSDRYPPHIARLLNSLQTERVTLTLFLPTDSICREIGFLRQQHGRYSEQISEMNVCLIIDSDKARRFPRTLVLEKKILMNILSSALGGSNHSPESTLPDPSPHVHLFSYGPSLQNRPTTISYELGKICEALDFTCILRVELARSLSVRFHEPLSEDDASQKFQALIAGTSLVEYNIPMLEHRLVYTKMLTFSQSQPRRDIVTHLIMYPGDELPQSLAVQASTSDLYNLLRYFVVTSDSKSVTFAATMNSSPQTLHSAFCHLHASTGSPVRALRDVNFTKTLMFSGQTLAAISGMVTPSWNKTFFDQGTCLYDHMCYWSSSIGRTGVPIPIGFTRFDTCGTNQNSSPILHRSLLNICPKGNLLTARKRPGQLIICLGEFLPTTGVDKPPFLYEDSARNLNTVWSIVQMFLMSVNKPTISGSGMDHGNATVREQLQAVLGNSGAILCMSCLPEHVKEFIRHTANSEDEISTMLDTCYLNLYTSQVFLILENDLLHDHRGVISSVGYLLNLAKRFKCQVNVLGITVESRGINVINDLEDPIDPLTYDLLSSDLPRFRVSFNIPVNVLPRSYPIQEPPDLPTWDESFQTIHGTLIQILGHPSVSNKDYIVRHINRCGQGLVGQQQGVGPLDIPLADYSLIFHHSIYPERQDDSTDCEQLTQDRATYILTHVKEWFQTQSKIGPCGFPASVMAVGEQPLKMKIDPVKGAIYGLIELVTNIMFSNIQSLEDIIVSASITWTPSEEMINLLSKTMFSCKEWCRELGLKLSFTGASSSQTQTGPDLEVAGNFIVFSGHANVLGNELCILPYLQKEKGILMYLPMIRDTVKCGTIFSQFWNTEPISLPDISPEDVRRMFQLVKKLQGKHYILSAHDVSDGGLLACVCEMALAGCRGLNLKFQHTSGVLDLLISEAPGAIIEIGPQNLTEVVNICKRYGIDPMKIGVTGAYGLGELITVKIGSTTVIEESVSTLLIHWSQVGANLFRDTIKDESLHNTLHRTSYGQNEMDLQQISDHLRFHGLRMFKSPASPKSVAVLHWPGCPDQIHMMSALTNVGFSVCKVMMSELMIGNLDAFAGIAIAGDCSSIYPIVEAKGIVQSVIARPRICRTLLDFLARNTSFSICCGEVGFLLLVALGVVGTESSDTSTNRDNVKIELEENSSGMFESLWLNFKIEDSKSILLYPLRNMIFPGWIQGTRRSSLPGRWN